MLIPRTNRWGYQQVRLGKETSTRTVHKLVAEAFICPKPSVHHQVNHINGIKTDNRAINLEWVSRSENMNHAYQTGLGPRSDRHGLTRLTSIQVREIKRRRKEGEMLRALASEFEMSVSGIHAIASGKSWKHLDAEVQS